MALTYSAYDVEISTIIKHSNTIEISPFVKNDFFAVSDV